MNRIPVQSSNLLSVGYEEGILEVEFVSGKVYKYFDVPAYVYDDLLSGGLGSVGRYFREAVVKSNYMYVEVKETKMEPEQRFCNECGERWTDTGDFKCPFCGSQDTEIDDSEDTDDEPEPIAA